MNGKITILMGKSPFLMGKSPFLIGKSPFLMGKSWFQTKSYKDVILYYRTHRWHTPNTVVETYRKETVKLQFQHFTSCQLRVVCGTLWHSLCRSDGCWRRLRLPLPRFSGFVGTSRIIGGENRGPFSSGNYHPWRQLWWEHGRQRSGFRGNQQLFRGNFWCQGNFNSWAASHSNALWMVVVLYMFWEKLGQMGWRQWCFVASHVWWRYCCKYYIRLANILSLPISSSIPHWFFRTWVTPNIPQCPSQGEIPGQRSQRVSLRKSHHGRYHRGWRHRGWNLPASWRIWTAQSVSFWWIFGMPTLKQNLRKHVMIWIWISIWAWYTIRYP